MKLWASGIFGYAVYSIGIAGYAVKSNNRWDFRKYLMAASRTNRMCGECSVFRVCGVPMANSYFTGPGGTGYARANGLAENGLDIMETGPGRTGYA